MTKTCKKCGQSKPASDFHNSRASNGKVELHYYCRACCKIYNKAWRTRSNYAKVRRINRDASIQYKKREYILDKIRRDNLRKEFIDAYGGFCECCGESEYRFLTLDHVENDGVLHRLSLGGDRRSGGSRVLINDLKRRGWPKGKHRLLCYNCNSGRALNGGTCPHETRKLELIKNVA